MWSIQPGSSSPAVHGSHMDLGILSPGEVHRLPHLSAPQPENVPPAAFWIPGYLQTPWKTPLLVPLGMQGLSPGSLLMQSPPGILSHPPRDRNPTSKWDAQRLWDQDAAVGRGRSPWK